MTPDPLPKAGARVLVRAADLPRTYATSIAWTVSLTLVAALGTYFWNYEGWYQTITYTAAITLVLIAGLTVVSRRILFSTALVAAVVAMVIIAAEIKRGYIGMVLHAYDITFYLTSIDTLSYLWVDHKAALVAILAATTVLGLGGRMLYRFDPTRVPRSAAVSALLVFGLIGAWGAEAKGNRRNLLFFFDHHYVSSFYASWSETFETLRRGQLIEASSKSGKRPFSVPGYCSPKDTPPHIILVHQESVVPPSQFPAIRYDRAMDPFFQSIDGKLHRLRVETYGGASWLTEFSVMSGLSTYSFGGMRTFVQSLMSGKVRDALPEVLARCGYHNTLYYPVLKGFVSAGRFYETIGMHEIFDAAAQKAKRFNERDRFYYGSALKNIEAHLKSSEKPLFSFIQTSAAHLPYRDTYDPEAKVPGGEPGTPPEMHEYLRRLSMARLDFEEFRAELRKRFPKERFLIVQYGDHQPIVTQPYLGFSDELDAEDIKMGPESPGLVTYYAVEGVNYLPPRLPDVETLDVPYLGLVILESAGLPLPDSYQERRRLLEVCQGRYFTCQDHDQILSFHRRLMESGLVDAR